MVKITFSGAWPAENRVQALRAVQRTLLDALHLQTDPAYYRIETEPAQARGVKAGVLVKAVAQITGGNGGGKPDFAMAGIKDQSKIDEALAAVANILDGQI